MNVVRAFEVPFRKVGDTLSEDSIKYVPVRPFVEVTFKGQTRRTVTADGPNPTWNQDLNFLLMFVYDNFWQPNVYEWMSYSWLYILEVLMMAVSKSATCTRSATTFIFICSTRFSSIYCKTNAWEIPPFTRESSEIGWAAYGFHFPPCISITRYTIIVSHYFWWYCIRQYPWRYAVLMRKLTDFYGIRNKFIFFKLQDQILN